MAAIDTFTETIERASHLINIHEQLHSRGKPPKHYSDILRAAVVLAVAAMDGYFHDLIADNVTKLAKRRKGKNLPGKLVEVIKKEATHEKLLEILHQKRPKRHIHTIIKKHLSDRTFQDAGKIEQGLKILGIDDFWLPVGKRLGTDKNKAKIFVQGYVDRRHNIVHQGDRRGKGREPKNISLFLRGRLVKLTFSPKKITPYTCGFLRFSIIISLYLLIVS